MVDELLRDGRSEPRLALDGDITLQGDRACADDGKTKDDGLEIIRNLIPQAQAHLAPRGTVLMETGEYNAEAAAALAAAAGFNTEMSASVNFGSWTGETRSSSSRVFATEIAIQPLPVHISQIVKRFSPRASIIERITSTARSTKISVSGFGMRTAGLTIKSGEDALWPLPY